MHKIKWKKNKNWKKNCWKDHKKNAGRTRKVKSARGRGTGWPAMTTTIRGRRRAFKNILSIPTYPNIYVCMYAHIHIGACLLAYLCVQVHVKLFGVEAGGGNAWKTWIHLMTEMQFCRCLLTFIALLLSKWSTHILLYVSVLLTVCNITICHSTSTSCCIWKLLKCRLVGM